MSDITFSRLDKDQLGRRLAEVREVDGDQVWMAWGDDAYLMDLPEKWSLSRVAEIDGAAVGYALCSKKGDTAWLHRLAVKMENRGSGFGAIMLQHVEEVARGSGYAHIGLKTPLENAGARKFYEEAGYREQGRESGYVRMSKALRPAVVGIHQPNYIPWVGYFYKLSRSDFFVILDDAFASKGSYVNRSKVLVKGEGRWLTVPVNRNDGFIHHLTPASEEWVAKHLATLQHNYQHAPYFDELMPGLREVMQAHGGARLSLLNEQLIVHVASLLGISTPFVRSSRYQVDTTGDDRLVDLIRAVGGIDYLSGSGGDKYQAPATYASAGVGLRYTSFTAVPYAQLGSSEFVPGLSVLDALFNVGPIATRAMIDDAQDIKTAEVPG